MGPYTLSSLWQISDGLIVLQTSRSSYLMYPYLISVYGLGAGEWIRPPTWNKVTN